MNKNPAGALYFVFFYLLLFLGFFLLFPQLPAQWVMFELVLYTLLGCAAFLFIALVYSNRPDSAGWMLQLLALNLVNVAFLLTLLPLSWGSFLFFLYSFLGVVVGVPFQAHYHPPKRERTIHIPPTKRVLRGKARREAARRRK